MRFEDKDKSLNNTPALENQAAKRQKLEGGQLRKVNILIFTCSFVMNLLHNMLPIIVTACNPKYS